MVHKPFSFLFLRPDNSNSMPDRKKLKLKSGVYAAFFLALFLLSNGCTSDTEKTPDISGVKVNLQTYRFDIDLYALDTNHIGEGLQKLNAKYPDFLDYFLDTLMAYGIHGNYADTNHGITEGLKPFLTFKDFVNLENEIKQQYPDSKPTDEALTDGFRYMKYYLPGFHIPKIIYVNMGLSKWPAFQLDSSTFCIGLDMFLGEQFPYYRSIGVQDYMNAHLRKTYIPVSVFSQIYTVLHPFQQDDKTLLDLMIQRGKEQYFLHRILPHTPDSVLFGFTQTQLKWCNANESFVYNFFIHQNLLYNKQTLNTMPYVNDGPFAKDMEPVTDKVKNTPGNVGSWLGYRLVCAYMGQHQKLTLQELLDQQVDAAKFLEETRYRPK
jgi:hypothetical protein